MIVHPLRRIVAIVVFAVFAWLQPVSCSGDLDSALGDDGRAEELRFDGAPFVDHGVTMVPMRGIFEWLGVDIVFDSGLITATVLDHGVSKEVRLRVGSSEADVGGVSVKMSAPPVVRGGRTYVPLRFVAETLGAEVEFDSAGRWVTVTGKGRRGYLRLPTDPMVVAVLPLGGADSEQYRKNLSQQLDAYEELACIPLATVDQRLKRSKLMDTVEGPGIDILMFADERFDPAFHDDRGLFGRSGWSCFSGESSDEFEILLGPVARAVGARILVFTRYGRGSPGWGGMAGRPTYVSVVFGDSQQTGHLCKLSVLARAQGMLSTSTGTSVEDVFSSAAEKLGAVLTGRDKIEDCGWRSPFEYSPADE